ncbi:hypothetical protein PQR62_01290 [Herbaspirillum lusitanum]|uniref:Uncharacterized protein n=1 Tax=Herbaspirillum lusitanum TaxID=213312 RepID=A0ABW9A4V5_9BURK
MAGPIGRISQRYFGATINLTPVLRNDGTWSAFVHIDFPDRTTHDFGDFKPGSTKMQALQNAVTGAEQYILSHKKR